MTLNGVLDEIRAINTTMEHRAYTFILGAGASISSGIPAAKTLAREWLDTLHKQYCHDKKSAEDWATESLGIKGFDASDLARFYPQIFERRFRRDPESGYKALENAMEKAEPSLGYSLLAEVMARTRHKVVVTTNFDNLVADALAIHAHKHPLVVGHESLAGFVGAQTDRPMVAKIHRDLFLHPKNDQDGVDTLEPGWKNALTRLFSRCTPLVMGYGGNDGSLMGLLEELPEGHIPGSMIWCYRAGSTPSQRVRDVVARHSGIPVAIDDFDGFMVALAGVLIEDFSIGKISQRIVELGKKRADSYQKQAEDIQKRLTKQSKPTETSQAAQRSLKDGAKNPSTWWEWGLQAQAETDPDQKDRIYREGLKHFPESAELHGNYALFLEVVRKDPDGAEAQYQKALELAPNNANATGNYASFLHDVRKDPDGAEVQYQKALELDPSHARNTANYALFFDRVRKDLDGAEALYRKALELDSSHANTTVNYSGLLLARERFDESQPLAHRAWRLAASEPSQTGAEALLYLALLDRIGGRQSTQPLGCLKTLLGRGFQRGDWDFTSMFDAAFRHIPEAEHDFYRALGAAILQDSAVVALDRVAAWQAIAPLPFDTPMFESDRVASAETELVH